MKKHYKIAFCGLGSIAHRHLRNTAAYLDRMGYSAQFDLVRSGRGKLLDDDMKKLITNVYSYSDSLPMDYDVIFVTNPTACHYDTILKYSGNTRSMFVEKPVFDQTNVDISRLSKSTLYYVACPLRYTNVLDYIKKSIDYRSAYAIRAISSSYLPDWRPNVDYRNTYSAHKELGGGVSIDLIHEWDYIISMFGFPKHVFSLIMKNSSLDINSDDVALYIGEYDNKTVEIHLDYYGRKTIRILELYMPDETIRADLVNGKIEFLCSGKIMELSEDRNKFQTREIAHFFNIVDGNAENDNTIEEALKILKIAKGEQ